MLLDDYVDVRKKGLLALISLWVVIKFFFVYISGEIKFNENYNVVELLENEFLCVYAVIHIIES